MSRLALLSLLTLLCSPLVAQSTLLQGGTIHLPGGETLVRKLIKLPRNRAFEWTHLAFLWYQHAVVSGYGMVDDLKLGLKNVGQIFGRRSGGTHRYGEGKNQFLETLDTGLDASV